MANFNHVMVRVCVSVCVCLFPHRKENNIFSYRVTRKMYFKLFAQTFVVTDETFILFIVITSRLI